MIFDNMFVQADIQKAALNAVNLKNDVILNNLANNDVPGYKRKTVEFESVFKDALETSRLTGKLDLNKLQPKVMVEDSNYSHRMDGNNIDIENEMTELYKNSLKYDAITNGVLNNFKRMNLVLTMK